MQTIKAIETQYKGYRFRSRLEARWAVFFDALGVKWEYEKEGFDLGEAGWYLPDFWLSETNCWVEMKGGSPTEAEARRLRALVAYGPQTSIVCRGLLFVGGPWHSNPSALHYVRGESVGGVWEAPPVIWATYSDGFTWLTFPDEKADYADPLSLRLRSAYQAARSARFEHGEKP
jgi:hypothetical protein